MVAGVAVAEGLVLPDSLVEVANEAAFPARSSRAGRSRLIELRRVIESGEYRVQAADLADALLHAARSAN